MKIVYESPWRRFLFLVVLLITANLKTEGQITKQVSNQSIKALLNVSERNNPLNRARKLEGIEINWFCPSDCSNINYGILIGGEITNTSDQPQIVQAKMFHDGNISLFQSFGQLILGTIEAGQDASDQIPLQPGTSIFFANQYAAPMGEHTIRMQVCTEDGILEQICTTEIRDLPAADLEIKKEVAQSTAQVGDTICYNVTVKNNGPNKAVAVDVFENAPSEIEIIEIICDGEISIVEDGNICLLGDIEAETSVVLTYKAIVRDTGNIINSVQVSTCSFDSVQNNNFAEAIFEGLPAPIQADVKVLKKIVSQTNPFIGSITRFDCFIINCGPDTAYNVQFFDTVETSMIIDSDVTTYYLNRNRVGSCTNDGQTIHCDQRDMAPGDTAYVGYHIVQVAADPSALNKASAFSDTPDPNLGNNSVIVEIEILPNPDLSIDKIFLDDTIQLGDTSVVEITWRNLGEDDALNVIIRDTLYGMKVVGPLPPQCILEGDVLICETAGIGPGEGRTFDFKVLPLQRGMQYNEACISYSKEDPNPVNDCDLALLFVDGFEYTEDAICVEQFQRTNLFDTSCSPTALFSIKTTTFEVPEFLNVVACVSDTNVWVIRNAGTYVNTDDFLINTPTRYAFDLGRLGVESGGTADSITIKFTLSDKPFFDVPPFYQANLRIPVQKISIEIGEIRDDGPVEVLDLDNVSFRAFPEQNRYSYKVQDVNTIDLGEYVSGSIEGYAGDKTACSPSATASAFEWLENKHSEIETNISLREKLFELSELMQRPLDDGPDHLDAQKGKLEFIDKYHLPIHVKFRSTISEIQKDIQSPFPSSENVASFITTANSGLDAWEWIKHEFEACEFLTLGFHWRNLDDETGAHAVSVVGIEEVDKQRQIILRGDWNQGAKGQTYIFDIVTNWIDVLGVPVLMPQTAYTTEIWEVHTISSHSYDPTINQPTSIKNNKKQLQNIRVYPNPIRKENLIHIEFDDKIAAQAQFKLTDLNGREYWKKQIYIPAHTRTLDLEIPFSLTSGTYLLTIETEDTQSTTLLNFFD